MIRRLLSLSSVCVVASVTIGVTLAQPKKAPDNKPAPAPAKAPTPAKGTPAPAPTPNAGSGSGSATPAPPDEGPPPKDMEGRDENPGNPGGVGVDEPKKDVKATVVPKKKTAGYPIEEAARPINLPQNMSEVAIGPHAQLGIGSGDVYKGADALRARYGITRRVQLGFTYMLFGGYDDPVTTDDKIGLHSGKAGGFDVTVLLEDWIGVRVGAPFYIKPVAASLSIGVPLRFRLNEKYTVGGMDDLLNIKLYKFAPSFYHEANNAQAVQNDDTMTTQSRGQLRFSGYGIMQYDRKTAFIGRLGFQLEDFTATRTQSNAGGGIAYFIRAGVQYSPRKWFDAGIFLGFDDLATIGSFGPSAILAARI
jgi:hypothetical protein